MTDAEAKEVWKEQATIMRDALMDVGKFAKKTDNTELEKMVKQTLAKGVRQLFGVMSEVLKEFEGEES